MWRVFLTGLAWPALVLPAVHAQQRSPDPPFRSGVTLVRMHATVLDRSGLPVRDLQAADFELTVDGRPRPVVWAQFVDPHAPAAPAGADPSFSTNEHLEPGRLVVLSMDPASLPRGTTMPLLKAAADFLDTLSPADRVALSVLPDRLFAFTSDRGAIREALGRVTGREEPDAGHLNIGLAEAFAIDRGDQVMLGLVNRRECRTVGTTQMAPRVPRPGPGQPGQPQMELPPPEPSPQSQEMERQARACEMEVRGEARLLAQRALAGARVSLDGLRRLLEQLGTVEGPKTLVLVSAGMLAGQVPEELSRVGEIAKAANVLLYVLQPQLLTDAARRSPSPTQERDLDLRMAGLEQLAGSAGGTLVRAAGTGSAAFERLGRELSGQYLLAFETEPSEGPPQPQAIGLQVRRPGHTVRFPRHVTPAAPLEPGRADRELERLLHAPLPATDLPLRVTHFSYRDAGDPGRVRLVIAAVLDPDGRPIERATVGFVLVDEASRVVGSETIDVSSSAHASTAIVAPGRYYLKVAAVDAQGRRGSVDRAVQAGLASAGPLLVSDLMLAQPAAAPDEPLRPIVGAPPGDALAAYLEVYARTPDEFEGVAASVEIADADQGSVVLSSDLPLVAGSEPRKGIYATLPIGNLPAGRYVARLRLARAGEELAAVTRPFSLTRAAAAGAPVIEHSREAGAAAGFGFRPPAFEGRRALRADVVGFALDEVGRSFAAAPSPGIAAALADARAGRFETRAALRASREDEQVAVSLVRGLALLARGELDPAANQFRAALRASPDFLPALIFLGACHAAGGREDEAAAVWQTALSMDPEAPVAYELLAEAWLRLDDPAEARAVLEEAQERWPEDDRFVPPLAAAAGAEGRLDTAMALLAPYLEAHPEAADAFHLAIRLIAQAHAMGRPLVSREEDLARARRYADAYAAAGGEDEERVAGWLRLIAGRR